MKLPTVDQLLPMVIAGLIVAAVAPAVLSRIPGTPQNQTPAK